MIKITFDHLPFTELRSNYEKSNFWYKRAEVRSVAREEAFLLCKEQVHLTKPYDTCEVEEVFTVPSRRHMDIEGLMVGCKSYLDGICDAGIIIDDDWKHVTRLSGRVIYKKGVEQTEIIITEVL